MKNLDDPKWWKECNRPLSPSECSFARMRGFGDARKPVALTPYWPFPMPDMQALDSVQAWVSPVRVHEEVGARVPKLSLSPEPVEI